MSGLELEEEDEEWFDLRRFASEADMVEGPARGILGNCCKTGFGRPVKIGCRGLLGSSTSAYFDEL